MLTQPKEKGKAEKSVFALRSLPRAVRRKAITGRCKASRYTAKTARRTAAVRSPAAVRAERTRELGVCVRASVRIHLAERTGPSRNARRRHDRTSRDGGVAFRSCMCCLDWSRSLVVVANLGCAFRLSEFDQGATVIRWAKGWFCGIG